ncbi:MAG: glycosyltransferase [Candidatus Electrothrix sp. GW3-4]|uniref:glycosyltransferase n=1 Tax=Candidatus Electrothrix sp. GW3-4 TaxID=3126740 RepID=UPI0030D42B13
MPDFSVIVPAWNAEKTLVRCLKSLTRQTLAQERYEIIIVDDGSTDRTADIADQFSVVYHYQENQGPAAARNAGVSLAKGAVIFFTDADCVPDPDWLEEMSAPFARPEVAAVKGAYRTEQKELIARFAQIEFEERFLMLEQRETIDMVDTYSAGFRKEIFLGLGGFDTRFPKADNEDTEFSYRMAEHGYTMVFTHRALVRHLNHPDSVLRYFRLKFSRGYWRLMVYRMHPERAVKDSYTPQTLKLQIIALFLGMITPFILFFSPFMGGIFLACFFLFYLALTFPFFRVAYKYDRAVAFLSPLLLALRAGALGSGLLWGGMRLWLGHDVFGQEERK